MTAINIFVLPDAVHVFTDGACSGPNGEILTLQNKVVLLPHLAACFAVRGTVEHWNRIATALGHIAADFDTVVSRAPGVVVGAVAGLASPHGAGFDLVLAGWSESRQAFEAYQLVYRGEHLPAAWTNARLGSLISPHDEGVNAGLKAAGLTPGGERPPIHEFGRIVTAVQRVCPSLNLRGAAVRTVGGFCQMTTLRRDGTTVEVLQRWPEDKIGCLIGGANPSPRHPGREAQQ